MDVRLARKLAKQHGLQGVIVIAIGDGLYSAASYGSTKAQCAELGRMLDRISDDIESGAITLDQFGRT